MLEKLSIVLCVLAVSAACRPTAQKGDAPRAANASAVNIPGAEPEQTPPAAAPSSKGVPLGLNLNAVNYYATAIPFVDAMKMADPFASTNAPGSGGKDVWDTEVAAKIPRDEDGIRVEAPFAVAGVDAPQILRASVVSTVYPGRYTVLYDGEGELAFPASSAKIASSTPGRIEVDVQSTQDGILFMSIVRSSRANHVRNIRVLLPGAQPNQLFHPTFLARLHGVGAVRFMDWGATNGHPFSHWSERTRPSMTQGGERGVAYEYMIDLANHIEADAWICVPHKADDAYVEALAQLIKARLAPQRKAYIEYSNELWNGIFPQAKWASEQGCKAGLNKLGQYTGSCEDDGVRYWAGIKWNARRTGEIVKIFDKVFSGTREKNRIVRVIAGHAHNEHSNEVLLGSFEDKQINRVGNKVDVLAIAPYLGGSLASDLVEQGKANAISVPELLDKLDGLVKSDVADATRNNYKIAQHHGVRLTAYEGGQHLVAFGEASKNGAFVDKLIAANRNPRMRSIYTRMLDAWYDNSGQGLLMLFNLAETPNKYGAWGLLESQEQPLSAAPKYQAFFDRLQRLSPPPAAATGDKH